MSNVQEITEKYLQLIKAVEAQNIDSAETQALIAALANESETDYQQGYKAALKKMTRNQKMFADIKARQAVLKARPTTPKDENSAEATPKKENAPKVQKDDTPAKKDEQKESKKEKKSKMDDNHTENQDDARASRAKTLPDNIAKDLHDYLYTTADDYSDDLANFISGDKLSAKEKHKNAMLLLSALKSETYKKSDAEKTDASKPARAKMITKLIGLTMLIYKEFQHSADERVSQRAEDLLKRMSGKSQYGYVERNKKKRKFTEDLFLKDLAATANPDVADFVTKIASAHAAEVLEKLDEKQKIKYILAQQSYGYGAYLPEIETKPEKNSEKPKDKTEGGTPMANDETTELTDAQKEELKKYEEIAKVTGLNLDSVDAKNYEDTLATLKKAERDFGVAPEGNSGTPAAGSKPTDEKGDTPPAGDGKPADGNDGTPPAAGDGKPADEKGDTKDPLFFEPLKDDKQRDEPQPEKPVDWVQKKIDHYTELAQSGQIRGFSYDKENKKEFKASFNDASILYTSENNVQVSEKAEIQVFETILNEEENKNRDINFAENMPHDMAMRLKAACLLHGRNMIGAQPEFTPEDLEKLSQELGPERFKEFQERRMAQEQQKSLPAPARSNENTDENKADKPLTESVKRLQEIRKDFEQKKADGLIVVKIDEKTREPYIESGPALSDKSDQEKLDTVKEANALIKEAAALVKSGSKTEANTKAIDAETNNAFNQERLNHIRSNMNVDTLAAHDAKSDKTALIHAKRMGLIDGEVKDHQNKDVQTLTGDALEAYKERRYSDNNPEMKARIDKVIQQHKQAEK